MVFHCQPNQRHADLNDTKLYVLLMNKHVFHWSKFQLSDLQTSTLPNRLCHTHTHTGGDLNDTKLYVFLTVKISVKYLIS